VRLHARFDAQACIDDIAQWRPTTTLQVPATMHALVHHVAWCDADLSSLEFVNSGSSIVPAAMIEVFHARGVPVAQVYGSTETGPFSIALDPKEARNHVGSVGRPVAGVEIRLVGGDGAEAADGAVGEILVRGPNVMRGYHREPNHPSFRDGWFHSGDLGRRDARGFYEVVGRSSDLIISGGEHIYPAEIENLVAGLGGVAECAVVGVPDAQWGEVPVLAVVPTEGTELHAQALRSAYEPRLARFKHPHRIVIVQALPKTALGKVRKAELAAAMQSAAATQLLS
jgi:fatty-acyl-CoA synthase